MKPFGPVHFKKHPQMNTGMKGTVYLIHFHTPLKHAKHYLGWATNVYQRLQAHKQGSGARLMQVLKQQGIGWKLARTWKGVDRNFERALKNRKGTPKLCSVCRLAKMHSRPIRVKAHFAKGKFGKLVRVKMHYRKWKA